MTYRLIRCRTRKGEALSDSDLMEWLALLARDSNDAIILADREGYIMAWNSGAERMYGYSEKEALGRDLLCLVPVGDRARERERLTKLWKGDGAGSYQTRRITKDCRILDVWVTASVLKRAGKPMAISVTERDLTGHLREEQAMKSRLASIVSSSDDAILGMTPDGTITSWNPGAEKLYGYTAEEAVGRSVSFLVPQALQGDLRRVLDTIKGGGQIAHHETKRIRKDGSLISVSMNASPIRDRQGRTCGVSWIARDLGEVEKIRGELAYLAKFPVYNPNPVLESSFGGKITYLNPAASRLFQDLKENAFGHPLFAGLEKVVSSLAQGTTSLSREVDVGGSCYLENIVILRAEGLIRIYASDVTARKQMEQELRESEAHLKKSQEIAHIGSWTWDLLTNRVYWSEEAFKVRGADPRADKPSPELYFSVLHPEDIGRLKKLIEDTFRNHRKTFSIDYRIVRKDGSIRYVHSEVEVQYDQSGKPVRLIGTGQDITDRKLSELALEDAHARSELYLDLMSHDIRNFNQIAEGFLELAVDAPDLGSGTRELLCRSLGAVQSSSRLIDSIIKLQKLKGENALKTRPVDLCEVLADIKARYSHISGRQVSINFTPVSRCEIMANDLVGDIFSNLVGNAIKHSDSGKPLAIDIRVKHQAEGAKSCLLISIEDNGGGIPDQLKGKLFARYEKGKAKISGRGLGLYIVKTLVEDFHGQVWVEDRVPGDYRQGARFVVRLPAAET